MKTANFLIIMSFLCLGCSQKEKPITSVNESRTLTQLETNRYNVAFLIMDGTFNTEFTAPFDIFQHTQYRKNIKAMNTFTVANTLAPISTFEGVKILPDFDYTKDSLPRIDILVVPSAEHHLDTDLEDTVLIDFVKKVDSTALYVTSHCDGAFVLAEAGLLNNVVSTTFPSDIGAYKKMFPDLTVQDSVLFVHDGRYITSAGGAKSFEAALYSASFFMGRKSPIPWQRDWSLIGTFWRFRISL